MRVQALTFMEIQEMIAHIIKNREIELTMEIMEIANIEIERHKIYSNL